MSDALFSAYQALEARTHIVDIVANNLANAQTSGFKKDFSQVYEEVVNEEGATDIGVRTHIDLSTGMLETTGRALDAAIDGPGFFVVATDAGERYTRAGNFQVNADGELVLSDGFRVIGADGGPIVMGEGAPRIDGGGDVFVNENLVGTLRIVNFDDPSQLEKEGASRFRWVGDESGVADSIDPRVRGGHLEASNVDPVMEMINLMSAFREFESMTQTLRSISNDMDQKLISELGSL
jgi:flagellar basal body rod protein FlgG